MKVLLEVLLVGCCLHVLGNGRFIGSIYSVTSNAWTIGGWPSDEIESSVVAECAP